jgi:hypothetical protein
MFSVAVILRWLLWTMACGVVMWLAFGELLQSVLRSAAESTNYKPTADPRWRYWSETVTPFVIGIVIPIGAPILGGLATYFDLSRKSRTAELAEQAPSAEPRTSPSPAREGNLSHVAAILLMIATAIPIAGSVLLSGFAIVIGGDPHFSAALAIALCIDAVAVAHLKGRGPLWLVFALTSIGALVGPSTFSACYVLSAIPALLCVALQAVQRRRQ